MINLNIKEYCQECPLFDPIISEETTYAEGIYVRNIICSKARICNNIEKYLRKELKKGK